MLVFHTYIYTWTLKKEKNGITILVLSDTTHINKFVNLKFYSVVPKQCTEKLFYQSKKKKKPVILSNRVLRQKYQAYNDD